MNLEFAVTPPAYGHPLSEGETLLAQGKREVEAGRRAGWAALLTGKKLTRGTKGQLFERQHCRTALWRPRLKPKHCKNHDSGGLVVKANNRSYRTDETEILNRYVYFRAIVLTKVV